MLNSKTRFERCKLIVRLGLLVGLAFFWTSCHHRAPIVAPPAGVPSTSAPIVQGQEGIASWYGRKYNGKRTASGQIYNMYAMTAAHRTLPFGTMVRVHDLENGRSVVVRINDRGPFVEGRIIDLSYAAARALRMPSTALVRIHVLSVGPGAATGIYAVQVGAFLDRNNADRLKHRIEMRFRPVSIKRTDVGNRMFNRVLVGDVSTEGQARRLADELIHDRLATQTFVVRIN